MAINEVLELYLERRQKIRQEQEQYEAKCKELGMGTDSEALEKILNTINQSSLPKEEKEIICDYINNWYDCYKNEYL